MKVNREYTYIGAVVIAGILWGFMGLFRRHLGDIGFDTAGIVFLRCGMAAVLMFITILIRDPQKLRVRLKDLWCFLGTGLCSMLFFSYCYYQSMTYMSLSVAAILLYTAPAIVVILSAILFKEAFTRRKLVALVLAFIGCCLVSGLGSDAKISGIGILYGLGAGFGYALYSVFARCALERGYHSNTVTLYTCLFAGLGAGILWGMKAPVELMIAAPENFFWSVGTAIITCYLPYMLYTYGLMGLETGKASIFANIEPVVATIVGIVIFHEALTMMSSSGILCVFAAVILLSLKDKKKTAA